MSSKTKAEKISLMKQALKILETAHNGNIFPFKSNIDVMAPLTDIVRNRYMALRDVGNDFTTCRETADAEFMVDYLDGQYGHASIYQVEHTPTAVREPPPCPKQKYEK